jgi:hypothetical protein
LAAATLTVTLFGKQGAAWQQKTSSNAKDNCTFLTNCTAGDSFGFVCTEFGTGTTAGDVQRRFEVARHARSGYRA